MPNDTKTEPTPPIARKQDPFRPMQPAIPGVPAESASKKPTPPRPVAAPAPPASIASAPSGAAAVRPVAPKGPNAAIALVAGAGICALLAGLLIYTKMQQAPRSAAASTSASVPGTTAELADGAAATGNLPVAPGVVASAEELAKPWSSKKFIYNDPMLGTKTSALVVRLPRGGYWGFSLKEPFGTCDLELVTDLQKLQDFYGFRADHPMVGDPCNKAVFDLLQFEGPSNAEVRGMPVHGMGVRPPIAIEIEQQGNEVRAVRME